MMNTAAPSLWLPAGMLAMPNSVLQQSVATETILGGRYFLSSRQDAPSTTDVGAFLAGFTRFAETANTMPQIIAGNEGRFARALTIEEESELVRVAVNDSKDPDTVRTSVLQLITEMSRCGFNFEEQGKIVVIVREKARNHEYEFFAYRFAAEAVSEMRGKKWSYDQQLKMLSSVSDLWNLDDVKKALVAMEEANWSPEQQISAFVEMQKRSIKAEMKKAITLLSFFIKYHPGSAREMLFALLDRMNEEEFFLPKDIVECVERTSSYVLEAISPDTAFSSAINRALFLKEWFGIKDQDNELPGWYHNRYIKPLTAIKLSDDLYIQFELGTAEASSGLQFSLFKIEEKHPLFLGSVGFLELSDRIVVVRYQGGDLGNRNEDVRKIFRQFSGGVDVMPWLGFFSGRFLLGHALRSGKRFEWLAGDNLLHGYPHLEGAKPSARIVESARQRTQADELEDYEELRTHLEAERAEVERALTNHWKRGELKGEEIDRLRKKLAELLRRIEWLGMPADILERAPGRQYDIIAKRLGLRRTNGGEFYVYSGAPAEFGRKIRERADDKERFEKSITAGDRAISDPSIITTNAEKMGWSDLLTNDDDRWQQDKNPFLTAFRPVDELATTGLGSGEKGTASGKKLPSKIASVVGTSNATILEDAGRIYLIRNNDNGELIAIDAFHSGDVAKAPYNYFPETGKMFRNGALLEVEIIADNGSVRVIKEINGTLSAWNISIGHVVEEKRTYFPNDKKAFNEGRLFDVELLEVCGYNHLIREVGESALQAWCVYPEGRVHPPHGIFYFPQNQKSNAYKRSKRLEQDGNSYLLQYEEQGHVFIAAITINPMTGEVNRAHGHYFPEHKIYYTSEEVGMPAITVEDGKISLAQQMLIAIADDEKRPVILGRGSDGSWMPLCRYIYIDDPLCVVTNDVGQAYLNVPIKIADSNYSIVFFPEPVRHLGREHDGSGYHENIEIIKYEGKDYRIATPDEVEALAQKYLGKRNLNLSPVGDSVVLKGEPVRTTLKTPKLGDVPAYSQNTLITPLKRTVEIVIEADTLEEYERIKSRLIKTIKDTPKELFEQVQRLEVYKDMADVYGLDHSKVGGSYSHRDAICKIFSFNLRLRSSSRYMLFHELIHSRVGRQTNGNLAMIGLALKADGAVAYRLLRSYFGTEGRVGDRGYFASDVGEYIADAGALLLLSILHPEELEKESLDQMKSLKFTLSALAKTLDR